MARGKYRGGHPTGKRSFSRDLGEAEEAARKKREAEAGGAASGSESDDSDDASGSGSEDVPGGQEAPPSAPKAASAVLALNLETSNPNAPKPASLKPTQVADGAEPVELTRREREAIEQQRAQARHWKLTEQGKTDEAVKDLARLTLIKAQREEAAKKRAEEKSVVDARKAAPKPGGK